LCQAVWEAISLSVPFCIGIIRTILGFPA
jgi:hypothetical protein